MNAYWALFLLPVIALLFPARFSDGVRAFLLTLAGAIYIVAIGLRFEVGADWNAYQAHYDIVADMSLADAMQFIDPGHGLLNWLSASLGLGVYGVNSMYAALLIAGLWMFVRPNPYPWLMMIVATPYLIIVVGMGYSRQAAAIGLILMALRLLADRKHYLYVLTVAAAALFHKTAIFMLAFALIGVTGNQRMAHYALLLMLAGATAYALFSDAAGFLWALYAEQQMESSGAWMRVTLQVVVALLFLKLRHELTADDHERRIYLWLALTSLALAPFVLVASTLIDRLMLYLLPLQLLVFTRGAAIIRMDALRAAAILAITGIQAALLAIWLNFATHADYWLPYHNVALAALQRLL